MNKTQLLSLFVGFIGVLVGAAAVRAAPGDETTGRTITYSGYLEEGSAALDGVRSMTFELQRDNGDVLWPTSGGDSTKDVAVTAGRFSVELGGDDMQSLPDAVFAEGEVFLTVAVAGSQLGGRQRLGTARQAVYADNGVPPGTIVSYGGDQSVPTGWLRCDGSGLSSASYPALFAAIGASWGTGATNCMAGGCDFNLPDLRGVFMRGVDAGAGRDPEASARTAAGSGGNTGDRVGTYQADLLGSHSHTFPQAWGFTRTGSNSPPANATYGSVSETHPTGGVETRPLNVSVVYLIKE